MFHEALQRARHLYHIVIDGFLEGELSAYINHAGGGEVISDDDNLQIDFVTMEAVNKKTTLKSAAWSVDNDLFGGKHGNCSRALSSIETWHWS